MKGVVLAGGLGTAFHPLTQVVDKHLLDVFDEPMVFFPIRKLAHAGISDITLVASKDLEKFKRLLGDGSSLGVNLTYGQQGTERGIPAALKTARAEVGEDQMVVLLGDNLFQEDLSPYVQRYEAQGGGARLLLKQVTTEDARRFGVASLEGDHIVRIEEKPAQPASNYVITGCYMYDHRVFEIISGLRPSARGELELTDVNNEYIRMAELRFDLLKGWWTDAGNPASKLKASILVALEKGVTFHA